MVDEHEKQAILSEVLEKGYFAIVREGWHKARGKGLKSGLRFIVGMCGFTVGFVLLRSAVAVQETMMDLHAWLYSKKKKKV